MVLLAAAGLFGGTASPGTGTRPCSPRLATIARQIRPPQAGLLTDGLPADRGRLTPGALLTGVWCEPGGTCLAAGYRQTHSTAFTLTERWNGAGWSVVPSPNPAGSSASGLASVTCTSPAECFAAGNYFGPNISR
jgi:hypothetical protein